MNVFDRYVFKNLTIATVFVTVVLTMVILLTQSLKFLELVINAGAGSGSFWILTFLALPRFFEIIMPLSLMAAVLFVYNRMIMDSEMVVIRSGGYSPANMARPAIVLAVLVMVFVGFMTMWAAPKSLSNMNEMRQIIRARISSFLFREGIFNQATKGLIVYVRENTPSGELKGVIIHDSRDETVAPSTTLAKRGMIVAGEDGYRVIVYDGSRQEYDQNSGVLHRLNFKRYTIDLPSSDTVRVRWNEPDERTIFELLAPNLEDSRDRENLREFRIEIHRRIISPVMTIIFTLLACMALLLGPLDRRGQAGRIMLVVGGVTVLQGIFLMVSNIARQNDIGLFLMYAVVICPLIISFASLGFGSYVRRCVSYFRGIET